MNKVSGFNQRLVALVAVIAVASGVALSSASANERHAAGTPTSLPPDVLSTVTAFHEALSAANGAAVEALLSPTVVIMESGNIERSREEYAGHHLPADLKFMRAMTYTLQRQSGDAIGDLAWVASEATLVGEYQGKPVNLVSMESLLLRKEQASWRIVHIHWSSRSQSERR
jgi:SnoaL-like domain